jgi:hypothetical protein
MLADISRDRFSRPNRIFGGSRRTSGGRARATRLGMSCSSILLSNDGLYPAGLKTFDAAGYGSVGNRDEAAHDSGRCSSPAPHGPARASTRNDRPDQRTIVIAAQQHIPPQASSKSARSPFLPGTGQMPAEITPPATSSRNTRGAAPMQMRSRWATRFRRLDLAVVSSYNPQK